MIKILRSSAGSGKTYNLAKKYIALLLQHSDDRYAYRHILAVTFTNKATAEMKNRILKELDRLAREPEASPYIAGFAPLCGGVDKVRERASGVLKDILHDYSAFSVSTIDKFFQQALRAFARELGQFSSYQVELDKESLVRESADRILDSIGSEDKPSDVRAWLKECLMDQLGRQGRMSLDNAMDDVVASLSSDELREVLERHGLKTEAVFSRGYLKAVRAECVSIIKDFRGRVASAAGAVLQGMEAAGLSQEDFSSKFSIRQVGKYLRFGTDVSAPPTAAFLARLDDPSQWFNKADQRYVPVAQEFLQQPLGAFAALFTGRDYALYNTAGILVPQVFSLGLALELEKEFKALSDEKNVICIDDSNLTLRNIIAGSDAPFIYEKLGVRFRDFLLDEFQDTSTIQWENFKPLLAESDAGGGDNLLVGDVKQSIYRWRGGDWTLLESGVKSDFPQADDDGSLRDNWRSQPQIIEFNNRFFDFAARALDGKLGEGSLLQGIYSDAVQTPRTRDEAPGYVKCTFCDSKDQELPEVLASVQAAREAGASFGQIAVLVRKNAQGSDVASFLVGNGVPVISDDSMKVKSSVMVRRLVSLLSCMDNEADAVSRFMAEDIDVSLPASYDSIYTLAEELLRSLEAVNKALYDGEVLYIQSFMDLLLDWSTNNGNSLSGFLKYWEGEDPKIASPDGTDAVRIITIHKAKGLEFPYVIFPFAGEEDLFNTKTTVRWCVPSREDGATELLSEGVFKVKMSSKTSGTLFAPQLKNEERMQFVDNINTFYVALTRAVKVLHTIAARPSKPDADFKCFADILYAFTRENGFEHGSMYDFASMKVEAAAGGVLQERFVSWPLRGRMRSTGSGAEVFAASDGDVELPVRLKGIVLHKILADVRVASDLPAAVARAVACGLAEPAMAAHYEARLRDAIASVAPLGWFSPSFKVLMETGIIDGDGSLYRPDRVLVAPDGAVTVIDYKFGSDHPSYAAQVRRYCRLFRDMGYTSVRGYLWFVLTSDIQAV